MITTHPNCWIYGIQKENGNLFFQNVRYQLFLQTTHMDYTTTDTDTETDKRRTMDYSSLAIWMGVLSLALIIAEFFIPSAGILTIFAVLSGVVSVWAGYQAWWERQPVVWWVFLFVYLSSVPSVLVGTVVILPRTRFGKRMMPDPPSAESSRPYVKEREKLSKLVGSFGTTATLHTPGGITLVDGRRYHSESQGLLIEPSTPVRIIDVEGNRIVIEQVEESEVQTLPSSEETASLDEDVSDDSAEENLDFPFPDK